MAKATPREVRCDLHDPRVYGEVDRSVAGYREPARSKVEGVPREERVLVRPEGVPQRLIWWCLDDVKPAAERPVVERD